MPGTEYQMAHIRLTPFDKARIATIREREELVRDVDAIRHALKFTAEFSRKKNPKKSSGGT